MADNGAENNDTFTANEAFLATLGIHHGTLQETPPPSYAEIDDSRVTSRAYSEG